MKNSPKVSVLLPVLNSLPFLHERLQTIENQTFHDWELVIVDGYSDDGSWELLQSFANNDARCKLTQSPRRGVYAALNECIRQTAGEYVYVATSDDTMQPNCLEAMVTALDAHRECDVCHTCLQIIDAQGHPIDNWRQFDSARFYGELINLPHIRRAPLDGLLHCALYMMYCSLTQLLMRRTVFEKVGIFPTNRGTIGDFEWGMRVGLTCNILHIPVTLATWRRHPEQATNAEFLKTADYYAQLCEMILAALPLLQSSHPNVFQKIRRQRLLYPYRQKQCIIGMGEQQSWQRKLHFLGKIMVISPRHAIEFVIQRCFGRVGYIDRLAYIQQELHRVGLHVETSVKSI